MAQSQELVRIVAIVEGPIYPPYPGTTVSSRILIRFRRTIFVPRTQTFCEDRSRLHDSRQNGLKVSASKERFSGRGNRSTGFEPRIGKCREEFLRFSPNIRPSSPAN